MSGSVWCADCGYRIIKAIARSVDLNTLHALSRTCRQFHANLSPYRQQLVKQTLRCENEYIETLSDMLDSGACIPDSVKSVMRLLSQNARSSGRLTSGKISKCARDMVAECRRCSKVVCRVSLLHQALCCPIPILILVPCRIALSSLHPATCSDTAFVVSAPLVARPL